MPSATAGEVQELRLLTRQIAAILKGSERQQWLKDLEPYEKVSYAITETLGECWAGWRVALIGATVPGRSGAASGGLIRSQEPILFRARQARFAASDRAFWLEQISGATRRDEQMVVATTVLAWADSELWPELFGAMMNWWNQLEQREVVELISFVQRLARIPQPGRRRPRQISPSQLSAFGEAVPATLVSFLLLRMKKSQHETLVGRLESAPTTEDHRPIVAANLLSHYTSTLKGKGDWTVSLPQVRNNYAAAQARATFVHDFIMPYELQRRVSPFATEILEHPTAYPLVLVRAADMNASTKVLRRLPALHKIAERDGWFSES